MILCDEPLRLARLPSESRPKLRSFGTMDGGSSKQSLTVVANLDIGIPQISLYVLEDVAFVTSPSSETE